MLLFKEGKDKIVNEGETNLLREEEGWGNVVSGDHLVVKSEGGREEYGKVLL